MNGWTGEEKNAMNTYSEWILRFSRDNKSAGRSYPWLTAPKEITLVN
jgi:hypothetical protein